MKFEQKKNWFRRLKTLERGFVYTTDRDGKTISSVKQVNKNDSLNLHFKDGQVAAKVVEVKEEKNANEEK